MTDAEFEAQKARLIKLIDYWPERLGLRWWHLTYEYVRDSGDFKKKADNDAESEAIATCDADWKYLHAMIHFNMAGLPERTDEELERIFVHELTHVLLQELQERQNHIAHEERVASMLTNAFIWTRDMARDAIDSVTIEVPPA